MKFRNVSPLGDLLLATEPPRVVAAGELFEVDDDLGDSFALQTEHYKAVDKPAKSAASGTDDDKK